jgi:nitrite reductase/ring-hydroxylating ferredoxin subunit
MSDALNYLVKMRPEAMGSYFKFLKEAGTHLDIRTRDLISVITKVDAQTEAGFKQYLTRALRNGATPDEILDALLMAFPTLGLAKIVWAADILVQMDIPEFRPELANQEPQWHDLAATDTIPLGEVQRLDCDSRHVFVYRASESEYKVYDSRCPHQVTDIPHLALQNGALTCPKHGWVFEIKSGDCIKTGTHPLKSFESKIENGRLSAYW